MLGVIRLTLDREGGSIKGEEDFFSVARTTPLVAKDGDVSYSRKQQQVSTKKIRTPLIPKDVTPWLTAFNAYSKEISQRFRRFHRQRDDAKDKSSLYTDLDKLPTFLKLAKDNQETEAVAYLPGREGCQGERITVSHVDGCLWSSGAGKLGGN